MDSKAAAKCLGELGNPTRLEIFRTLVRAGDRGLTIGDVQSRVGIPPSTLAFHLRALASADLIAQEKDGRAVWCRPRYDVLREVMEFLSVECCAGFNDQPPACR